MASFQPVSLSRLPQPENNYLMEERRALMYVTPKGNKRGSSFENGTAGMGKPARQSPNPSCFRSPFGGKNRNKDADALLVEELKELSVMEREKVYEDIHGVAKDIEETPELIEESLKQLHKEIAKAPRRKRTAYDRALFLKPSLVNDDKFHLRFLRADCHDPVKAAARICRFFQHKRELFGSEKLAKTITLEDLDEDAMDCLRSGCIRPLPHFDQSGRRIILADLRSIRFKDPKDFTRFNWYVFMRMTDEEVVQIKGVVVVNFAVGPFSNDMFSLAQEVVPRMTDIPIRFSAIHYCFDNPSIRPILSLFQVIAGSHIRLRVRPHFGSILETQYELLTFGIRLPDKVLSGDADARTKAIDKFIEERKKTEEAEAVMFCVGDDEVCAHYPTHSDVLVGRGRPYHTFPGNEKMNELVEEYRSRYIHSSERYDKTVISTDILESVKAKGGRFLQRTPEKGGWSLVTDAIAREKICQALRNKTKTTPATTPSSFASAGVDTSKMGMLPPVPNKGLEDALYTDMAFSNVNKRMRHESFTPDESGLTFTSFWVDD